ncbi:hypothetical protein [Streptomyces cellostaticus]|uniref:hypothetical protein n=1 Tax=Streptomyces cellostaticus TaxID=67285 RepID=UPI0037D9DFB7
MPWLADHAVHGTVLLPGTAFVDLAVHARGPGRVRHAGGVDAPGAACPSRFPVACSCRSTLATVMGDSGRRTVTVSSREREGEWVRHAVGVLAPGRWWARSGSAGGLASGRCGSRFRSMTPTRSLPSAVTAMGRRSRACVRFWRAGDHRLRRGRPAPGH